MTNPAEEIFEFEVVDEPLPAEREDDVVVASAIQASPLDADRVEQCRRVRVHADWAHKLEPAWTRVFDMTDDELVSLFGRSRSGDTAIRKVEQYLGAKPTARVRVNRDDAPAPEIELQRPACPVCYMEKSVMGGCQCDVDGGRGEHALKLSSKITNPFTKKEKN